MEPRRRVKVSKYLSRHLRHQPERLGLTLQVGGWVAVEDLLRGCAAHGMALTREELAEIVRSSDKQRFSFDASGLLIRANQGHSVAVDLGLETATPPSVLYHGTGAGFVAAILSEGLKPMGRHDVHLSVDVETARRVGARHGAPVVLKVDAAAMAAGGYRFSVSVNGVWLTAAVPPEFLRIAP